MSQLTRLKRMEQDAADKKHKSMCKIVCKLVEDRHVDANCVLVSSLLNSDWAKVARFFERVKNGSDVSDFVGSDNDTFHEFIRALMRLHMDQPETRFMPVELDFDEEVQPRRKRKAVNQLQFVVLPLVLVALVLYVGVNIIGTDLPTGKPSDEGDNSRKVLEEHTEKFNQLQGVVGEYQAHVAGMVANQKLVEQARDDRLKQLERKVVDDTAKSVQDAKAQVDAHLSAHEDRLKEANDAYGKIIVHMQTVERNIETAEKTVRNISDRVEQVALKVPPLSDVIESLQGRTRKLEVELAQSKEYLAQSFYVCVGSLVVTLLVCLGTAYWIYFSVSRVYGVNDHVNEVYSNFLNLLPSHQELARRVSEIEVMNLGEQLNDVHARLDALEVPGHVAGAAPAGPGARRGRGRPA